MQAWDRFAYTNNSPVAYNDPTGHSVGCEADPDKCDNEQSDDEDPPEADDETSTTDTNPSLDEAFDEYGNSDDLINPSNDIEYTDDPNIIMMVVAGMVLTFTITGTELLLVKAEVAIAPFAAEHPLVGVPVELGLISLVVLLVDIDVAYWSYVYRTYQAGETQKFEWLPSWGFE